MTARVVIVDVMSRRARFQQGHSGSVLDELRVAWVVPPSHRERVALPGNDDGFPPAFLSIGLGDYEVAHADVIPVARVACSNAGCGGGGVRIRRAGLSRIVGGFSAGLVLTIGHRSGARCRDQLVVKIPAHVWHKTTTVGMDAAGRKLLGDRG